MTVVTCSGWAWANASAVTAPPLEPKTAARSVLRRVKEIGAHLFLRNGYLGTRMDEVAGVAKVSKQTVYKHFGDKRSLFVEFLTGDMGGADAAVATLAQALPGSQRLEVDLRAFARAYLKLSRKVGTSRHFSVARPCCLLPGTSASRSLWAWTAR